MKMKKKATAISIIGGADGPTSVFIAGKRNDDGKEKKSSFWQRRDMKKKNRRFKKLKRKLIRKGIESHTLEELEEYICTKYGAIAIRQDLEEYQRALKSLKTNLVLQYYEDLIPIKQPAFPEENLTPEGLKEYNEKIQEWFRVVEDVSIPEDEINFHYYRIDVSNKRKKGEIYLELELKHQLLNVSSSYYRNNNSLHKKIDRIIKDIYFYYGETIENMEKDSERFLALAAALDVNKKKMRRKRKTSVMWYLGGFLLMFHFVKWISRRISLCKNA